MAFKQSKHVFQGMSRDLSEDKQKAIFYIDAHNIRITAREDTTLLSVTNEKGNTKLEFTPEDGINFNEGQYIGHAVLNDYLILFTIKNSSDEIWRINLKNLSSKRLFSGKLNFDVKHPIETLVDYETEDVQKVYWTDGINQPRVINIVNTYPYSGTGIYSRFDFIPEVYPNGEDTLSVEIFKVTGTDGLFTSGTIQYFITYYNKFGQESSVVWQSPLYYISPIDRGGSPTETVSNSFRFNINNPTSSFDYLRIYSIQHTSEDTTITAKRIVDLTIKDYIEFIDNGTLGETIDPTDLYYKGGTPLAAYTMSSKDQTLFLGNITIKNKEALSQDIIDTFKNIASDGLEYVSKSSYSPDSPEGKYYDYNNQLNYNSSDITTYKYKETYRFGLQFQDKWGRWSEPLFLKDFANDEIAPYVAKESIFPHHSHTPIYVPKVYLAKAQLALNDANLISTLKNTYNYVKVRPLIVFPAENERECVAQGVLCPTVYNVQDRIDNSPFAQPSWFFRPYWPESWPYNIYSDRDDSRTVDQGTLLPYAHNGLILGGLSLRSEIEKSYSIQGYYTGERDEILISKPKGSSNTHFYYPNFSPAYEGYFRQDLTQINNPKEFYYIDQSLVTLNSPDIDFGNISSTDNLSFRVIGALNITGCYGTMYLNTQNSPNTFWRAITQEGTITELIDTHIVAKGFYKKDIAIKNYNNNDQGEGWRIFGNGPYWIDVPYYYWKESSTVDTIDTDFLKPFMRACEYVIYPWQSTGSLGGGSFNIPEISTPLNGELKQKIISNIRYSPETVYLSEPLNYDTSDIQLTNDVSKSTITLNVSEDLHYKDRRITYYSNIDKLLSIPEKTDDFHSYPLEDYKFDITVANKFLTSSEDPTNIVSNYKTARALLPLEGPSDPINPVDRDSRYKIQKKYTATSITYKSTPHAVIALSPRSSDTINILPSINSYGRIPEYRADGSNPNASVLTGDHNLIKTIRTGRDDYECVVKNFWQTVDVPFRQYVHQDNINLNRNFQNKGGILLIGEIYRPAEAIVSKFGGDTEDALQQNLWIPAGASQDLTDTLTISWTEGDTYFQRYDCLKTYPYSNENENNIVEILSFMCESRINIAGRYDKNRGLLDNTYITNENFNLLNKGYTQKDNFFSYRILDERFNLNKFKTQLTWTKVKSAGALLDNWTNVTLANTLDLDGDKGELVSLNKYKNEIIAFQSKGISQIIYNPNVQISTESGIPIEIANSGRVQGKRYLYEGVGSQNKWSVCDEVYDSIYFIDNLNKSIYRLGDQGLVSLTDTKGFKEWMNTVNSTETWIPYSNDNTRRVSGGNFRTFYDKTYKDLYFVNGETCLVYSNLLDQFVSFMDYQGTNSMFNVGGNFYSIYNNSIWQQFAGEYNDIYDKTRNYWITFIDNPIPEMNKIFTNLEFRSDTYNGNTLLHDETFDSVRVFNEYQDSDYVSIKAMLDRPYITNNADLKKKFRVWRIQLPRDKSNILNRINNTWTKITLMKNKPVRNEKTVLHDAMVGYYI